MGKIIYSPQLIKSFVAVFLMSCFFIACSNNSSIVIIEGPTKLLYKPDWEDAPGNKVIAILKKGDKGKVIHIRYSKDAMFYKIKLEDGRSGYVMFGKDFKVIEKKNSNVLN